MSWRVLVSCHHLQQTIDRYRDWFAKENAEIVMPRSTQQLSESDLLGIIADFDGVIAGDDHFTAAVIEKATRLKVISKWGIGVDAIDHDACRRHGVRVFNTPDVFADECADVVVGYLVLLARQLHRMDQSVRSGGWLKVRGRSLRDKTLGVIGVGSIGRAVVRRGRALGMKVLGYDVMPPPDDFIRETGARLTSLEELLTDSDFITLNCNLTASNRHLMSGPQFTRMKPGSYLINTSRGPLVDEAALIEALRTGKLSGAALDVYEREPLPSDSPLLQFENCIFGTHNSSNTIEAVLRVNELSIRNLFTGLRGESN